MKRTSAVTLLILFLLVSCTPTNEGFQEDADIFRLKHIKYYGEILEEYFQKNKKYPFQGETDLPLYVYIANDRQLEYTNQKIPYSHKVVPLHEFISEIESGIERTVEEYYDPQYVPVNKPNFYIYMIYKGRYFFAVHVHQPFPFSRKIAENYYKVEITNRPNIKNNSLSLKGLVTNEKFIEEIGKSPRREGLFLAREKRYLHYTKEASK